jgi:hypothetical protein
MARAKTSTATGEKKTTTRSKKANGNGAPTGNLEEVIRTRAYELYLSRGGQDGAHESDWYAAEAEVRTRTA